MATRLSVSSPDQQLLQRVVRQLRLDLCYGSIRPESGQFVMDAWVEAEQLGELVPVLEASGLGWSQAEGVEGVPEVGQGNRFASGLPQGMAKKCRI